MKVLLVCGDRNWTDEFAIQAEIARRSPDLVVHGGCRGADLLADKAAKALGIHTARIDALWRTDGKYAGPARNIVMAMLLDAIGSGSTVQGLAFHNDIAKSKGTKGMFLELQQRHIHCDIVCVP